MLINGYKVSKRILTAKKTLTIRLSSKTETIEYVYSGDGVFLGDYWNSIFIGRDLFDLNLYSYEKFKLVLYRVENNVPDFLNSYPL